VVAHDRNRGVGAAIVTGYQRALADGIDVTAVMAADNQMDPGDLGMLVLPVARGEVDYAKSNRLVTGEAWKLIPRTRYLGNAVLSLLTKVASGYWHVADSQSGYTAISKQMLDALDLDRIYTGYGFPNDFLVHLNVWNARVRDFPSRPIYGVGERSGIRYHKVVRGSRGCSSRLLLAAAEKYVIRDFHRSSSSTPSASSRPWPASLSAGSRSATGSRERRERRDRRAHCPAAHFRLAVHAVRDVVRHGVEQGSALDLSGGGLEPSRLESCPGRPVLARRSGPGAACSRGAPGRLRLPLSEHTEHTSSTSTGTPPQARRRLRFSRPRRCRRRSASGFPCSIDCVRGAHRVADHRALDRSPALRLAAMEPVLPEPAARLRDASCGPPRRACGEFDVRRQSHRQSGGGELGEGLRFPTPAPTAPLHVRGGVVRSTAGRSRPIIVRQQCLTASPRM
jgi:hypothetical protein